MMQCGDDRMTCLFLMIASFMSQLDESHILGLVDIELSMGDDGKRFEDHAAEENDPEVEEIDDPMETQTSVKKTRSTKYNSQEDIALCLTWMNISLDALVGTDQPKDKFGI